MSNFIRNFHIVYKMAASFCIQEKGRQRKEKGGRERNRKNAEKREERW